MKLLQIGKFYPPYHFGGIETVSKNIHNGLRENGIDADFLGFLAKGAEEDIIVDNHVFLCKTDIDKFSTQLSVSFVKRWYKIRNNYDIIFINMPHPFVNIIVNLFKPKNTKIVLYWHGDIIKYKFFLFFYKPFLISLIKNSVAIVAATSVHVDESDFSRLFIGKKYIIPYPLKIKLDKSKYVLYQNKKVIFSCGRLIYYKGFNVLIEAAKYLSDDCIIKIAGDGKLKKSLEAKIDSLQLDNKVVLLGRVSDSDLINEMKKCYLFCLPSNYRAEMFGVVQVEAFAFGKPVISTNIPRSGVPEVNINNKTGYAIEINNPIILAKAIQNLLQNESLYDKFSTNAFERARYFVSNTLINSYIDLFNKLYNKS